MKEGSRGESLDPKSEKHKTIPGPEHEGWKRFSVEIGGDISEFGLPQSKFDRFEAIAKSRGTYTSDLIRAAVERYGFSEKIFDQVIAEEEGGAKKTLPGEKHEGYVDFMLDDSYFSIPRKQYQQLQEMAADRKTKMSNLLRAAIDRYGFSDALRKLLAEESKDGEK